MADEIEPNEQQQQQEPPDEEELRKRLEQQLRELRVDDLLLQSIASLLNLSARRIAKEDERDLVQAKLGIDAVRAVVDLLPEKEAEAVRNALSELQVLYARHAEEGEPPGGEESGKDPPETGSEEPKDATGRAGDEPKGGDSGLWTPPGT